MEKNMGHSILNVNSKLAFCMNRIWYLEFAQMLKWRFTIGMAQFIDKRRLQLLHIDKVFKDLNLSMPTMAAFTMLTINHFDGEQAV